MNNYINNIINNHSFTPEQIALVIEWMKLDHTTGGISEYKNLPQILSSDWEKEILG